MNERDPVGFLQHLGADDFAHFNGSLASHLHATEALLRAWGSREDLCRAGLYHSVYGTQGIRCSLVDLTRRKAVARVIGAAAERRVYLFGACDRERFHPRIGTTETLVFADRFTGSEYTITKPELRDFCELTLANELELAHASDDFRTRHRADLLHLLERMRAWVSDSAREACRRTLR